MSRSAAGVITPRMVGALLGVLVGVGAAYAIREVIKRDPPPPGVGGFQFVRSVPGNEATIWAVGDGDASRRGRAVTDFLGRQRLDRLIYLGDVYEDGTEEEFATNYAPTYGRFAGRTAPTPGNHEWGKHESGYDPYWRRALGQKRAASWYAFDAGGWRILSINSETDHDRGSPQEQWLRRELAKPGGTCRIVFWHRPRYSAGKYGDQRDMAPIWNALPGRAAIVLSGHEHHMQRLHPIDGITTFISGAGGRSSYEADRKDRRLAFAETERDGALRLGLRRDQASYAFVAATGETLDSGTVRCRR